MRDNRKLRDVYDDLVNNPHTVLVNKRPAVFKWQSSDATNSGNDYGTNNSRSKQAVK